MDKIYTLEELDALLKSLPLADMDKAVGLSVEYEGQIVHTVRIGDISFGLEVCVPCAKCHKKPTTHYICRNYAGWYAIFTEDGRYLADTRTHDHVCTQCYAEIMSEVICFVLCAGDQDMGDPAIHRPPVGREILN